MLYDFICVNGLKILINNQIDFNNTKNIVVVATMLVLGLGGKHCLLHMVIYPYLFQECSLQLLFGVILNLCILEEKHE